MSVAKKIIGQPNLFVLESYENATSFTANPASIVYNRDFKLCLSARSRAVSRFQTGQPFPAKNNKRDKLDINKDGSVDLYFGPKAPKGKENNWLQTVHGKGWFTLLRLYSPTEAWFEGKWLPGEFELVD